ncbi:hypothetical protein Tco_1145067 [Tanacetum coccineum]
MSYNDRNIGGVFSRPPFAEPAPQGFKTQHLTTTAPVFAENLKTTTTASDSMEEDTDADSIDYPDEPEDGEEDDDEDPEEDPSEEHEPEDDDDDDDTDDEDC